MKVTGIVLLVLGAIGLAIGLAVTIFAGRALRSEESFESFMEFYSSNSNFEVSEEELRHRVSCVFYDFLFLSGIAAMFLTAGILCIVMR